MTMRLEHVALNVADPDAMARWYTSHLGMQIVRHIPTPNATYFLADSARMSVIEIYHNPAAPVPDYAAFSPLALHLAFSSSDMEADIARLVAAGATHVAPIDVTPAGDRLTFLRDPWQVAIQLAQRKTPLLQPAS
jgi:glyoxylase I family protein